MMKSGVYNVAVIGLGYVGLPLACNAAVNGINVIGYDLNGPHVENILNFSFAPEDKNLHQILLQALHTGRLKCTNNLGAISDANVYIVCVPTPILEDGLPDLGPLTLAVQQISKFLVKGDTIVVESTVFPGTCQNVISPIIEDLTNLNVPVDINIVHCPERVNPGDKFWTPEIIPRVMGGICQTKTLQIAELYAQIQQGSVDSIDDRKQCSQDFVKLDNTSYQAAARKLRTITVMNSVIDAEAVKVVENTVRDINIAVVNELSKIADVLNFDVMDVITGMETKPFGKGPFYPGDPDRLADKFISIF